MGDFFKNFSEIWSLFRFSSNIKFLILYFSETIENWRNLKNLPEFLSKLKNEKIADNFWEILRNISTRVITILQSELKNSKGRFTMVAIFD